MYLSSAYGIKFTKMSITFESGSTNTLNISMIERFFKIIPFASFCCLLRNMSPKNVLRITCM